AFIVPDQAGQQGPDRYDCPRRQRADQPPVAADPLGHHAAPARPPGLDRPVFQEPPQVVGQLLRRGVTVRGVLFERFEDDRFQLRRNHLVDSARPPRLLEGDLLQQFLTVRASKDRLERQQLIQRRSERIDIRAVVDDYTLGKRL